MLPVGGLAVDDRLDDHEHDAEPHGTPEQECAVVLDLARLDLAECVAGLVRGGAGAVDDGVDHALVDVAVGELADLAGGGGQQ